MESWTKRIVAIILITVIGTGVGGGVWFFFFSLDGGTPTRTPPDEGTYSWSASDTPGAPSSITTDQIIKIGCAGDTGKMQGDANYEGTWFAAKEINEAGGIVVKGKRYYFGVTREDTDEINPQLNISRAVAAARRLIYNKTVDFAIGGFRSEALEAYLEEFMSTETIFLGTGAPDDIFGTNVIDDYDTYKYFFRFMPINSTELAFQLIETLADFILKIDNTYSSYDVKQIGILAEDLAWTEPIIAMIQAYLPLYTNLATGGLWEAEVLTPILYDINISAADMNLNLQSLELQGADIVIPLISGSGGILMMLEYELNQYEYLIFGIDEQSQLDTFWEDSWESAAYETIMQLVFRTNKVSTIAFWDAFIAEFAHEPLYIAVGAYDAVNALKDAIVATQSLETNDIIAHMETWTKANPHPGVSRGGAWWPNSHELVGGYPYVFTLWTQWQPDGTKIVIPASIYSISLATGAYTMPPWVHTAWTPDVPPEEPIPEEPVYYTPGVPPGISSDQIIMIGCAGDTGEIEGDANFEGTWFAAKEINEAGGIVINGITYYFGVTKEDTDESATQLVISRGVDAARRLIFDKEVDFAIGGFRSEALLAYIEEFMDAEILFLGTGASTDIFCENVRNDYENYKWFFRYMPINLSSFGGELFNTLVPFMLTLNATYPNFDITQVGVIAEDLTWTAGLVAGVVGAMPALSGGKIEVLTPIMYDITLSASDMNIHLQTLQSQGADFVIPIISGSGGILMMQQYSQYEYEYIIFGIDKQAELDTFWADSGGSAAYETIIQTLYRTAKTPLSIPFWDAFIAEFGYEPHYIASGAYDAVNGLKDAIVATDSLDNNDIIAHMETWTKANPNPGVSGGGAWWPDSHDLVKGYPYGFSLWTQWQADGSKIVIPTSLYPAALATGTYAVPPWVIAAWSA